jgi:protein tyrosine/serine phosphatase
MVFCPTSPVARCPLPRMLVRGCGLGLAAALLYQASYVLIGANFRTVVPGQIYRCAQLSARQLDEVVRQNGIRTVINLRGCCEPAEWYLNQSRVLSECQVSQEDLGCSAGRLPSTQTIQELVHVLEQTEYPILVHCHRGIDRTGLVIAVALILHCNRLAKPATWIASSISTRNG